MISNNLFWMESNMQKETFSSEVNLAKGVSVLLVIASLIYFTPFDLFYYVT